MNVLYIECNMGAAGDMLMAALFELIPDKENFLKKINSLFPNVKVHAMLSQKCGITGTHIKVKIDDVEEHEYDCSNHSHVHSHIHSNDHSHSHGHEHAHSHTSLSDIRQSIDNFDISDNVKHHAFQIYQIIAQAESVAHGQPVEQIHFHEVGEKDAIVDIVGVCMLIEELSPDKIFVSPVHLGSGNVKTSHGILPVPAPATAHILEGVPVYAGSIQGELCTPTGAAILRYFSDGFCSMPPMSISKIGYGMGTKDFERANCVRVFYGKTSSDTEGPNDSISELSCNLDDMSGEAISAAISVLFKSGALDVFTCPIYMKKNRPAQMLVCLCRSEDADEMAQLMLKHTTTFGVRKTICERYILDRSFESKKTDYGEITVKHGRGYGIEKSKIEFDSLLRIAEDHHLSVFKVIDSVKNL